MALTLQTIGSYVLGGAILGTGWYFYRTGFFDNLFSGIGSIPPDTGTGTPLPTGNYAYYAKRKFQCRDAHLTESFIASQGAKLRGYKVFNDGLYYPQVCNTQGPLTILVAIDVTDGQSGSILNSLGFIQYTGPGVDPTTGVAIPNPPYALGSSSQYAMVYVGKAGAHRAYKSYRGIGTY